MSKPLENVKILDLSRVLAGPFCTMLLSELGAYVLKIEMPGTGDDSRAFGPFKNDQSAYFVSINRGKESISLNMKTEKGRKIFLDLLKKFDVVIENFRPGTMEKLGFGYESLKKIKPDIIYAACSGFGHSGPYSHKPAYDVLMQAMGGLMSITGWPGNPPTRVGISIGDISASLYTAIGINAALYHKAVTGEGQKIDVSMLDCQVSLLENAILRCQTDQKPPEPFGNRHPTITPFQAYMAKDVYFAVGVGNENQWKKFCKAIDRCDLIEDERFASIRLRTKNIDELNNILTGIFLQKNAEEWFEIFDNAEIPNSPVNNVDKLISHPQVNFRNMIVDVEDKKAGKIKVSGNAIKMSTIEDKTYREHAPDIGEHNHKIYHGLLGFSIEEIEQLKNEGVI